jgi:hypothetical protein
MDLRIFGDFTQQTVQLCRKTLFFIGKTRLHEINASFQNGRKLLNRTYIVPDRFQAKLQLQLSDGHPFPGKGLPGEKRVLNGAVFG